LQPGFAGLDFAFRPLASGDVAGGGVEIGPAVELDALGVDFGLEHRAVLAAVPGLEGSRGLDKRTAEFQQIALFMARVPIGHVEPGGLLRGIAQHPGEAVAEQDHVAVLVQDVHAVACGFKQGLQAPRFVGQGRFGPLAFGNVQKRPDHALADVGRVERRARYLAPEQGAVLAPVAIVGAGDPGLGELGVEFRDRLIGCVGNVDQTEILPFHLVGRIAEHFAGAFVGLHDDALARAQENGHGAVVQNRPAQFALAPEFLFGALALGDVAQHADRAPALVLLEGRDRQGDGDFHAVLAPGRDLDGLSQHRPGSAVPEGGVAGRERLGVVRRHEQRVQVRAERFLGAVAQGALGRRVPKTDPAVGVDHEDGVRGAAGDGQRALFALVQFGLGQRQVADMVALAAVVRGQGGAGGRGDNAEDSGLVQRVRAPDREDRRRLAADGDHQRLVQGQADGIDRDDGRQAFLAGGVRGSGEKTLLGAALQVAREVRAGPGQVFPRQLLSPRNRQVKRTVAVRDGRAHVGGVIDRTEQRLEIFRVQGGGDEPGKFAGFSGERQAQGHGPGAQDGFEGERKNELGRVRVPAHPLEIFPFAEVGPEQRLAV